MSRMIRAICKNAGIKAIAIDAGDIVERARVIHGCEPLACAALGRSLIAASMLGAELKSEDASLTLQIKGGGPLGTITAVSDSSGNVRGYLQDPSVDLPLKGPGTLDVGAGVGTNGQLTVIKDLGMREPFIGSVKLVSGEIAEDVTMYLAESEQIPSVCALGVLVDTDKTVWYAGGCIVSLLPDATEEDIALIEDNLTKIPSVTTMLHDGLSLEEILGEVLYGLRVEFLEESFPEYRCNCSEERVSRALISMGARELHLLMQEKENVEVTCQFCDKIYNFGQPELKALFEEATNHLTKEMLQKMNAPDAKGE